MEKRKLGSSFFLWLVVDGFLFVYLVLDLIPSSPEIAGFSFYYPAVQATQILYVFLVPV
jgi:hypothetical protein